MFVSKEIIVVKQVKVCCFSFFRSVWCCVVRGYRVSILRASGVGGSMLYVSLYGIIKRYKQRGEKRMDDRWLRVLKVVRRRRDGPEWRPTTRQVTSRRLPYTSHIYNDTILRTRPTNNTTRTFIIKTEDNRTIQPDTSNIIGYKRLSYTDFTFLTLIRHESPPNIKIFKHLKL